METKKKLLLGSMLVVFMLLGGLFVNSATVYGASESGVDGEIAWKLKGIR